MAILTDSKIKNIIFNFIENATAEELKEMAKNIKQKLNANFWQDFDEKLPAGVGN